MTKVAKYTKQKIADEKRAKRRSNFLGFIKNGIVTFILAILCAVMLYVIYSL